MLSDYAVPADPPYNVVQVEPEASYWFRRPFPILRTVPFQEIQAIQVKPYETDLAKLDADIVDLRQRFRDRDDPLPPGKLSKFLTEAKYTANPPTGSVVSTDSSGRPRQPLIQNGMELASLFENETPGLWHRHVLNVLFDPSDMTSETNKLSPPLQALVWSALDVAIASALMAAWHFKWLATSTNSVSRRQRPVEYAAGGPDPENFKVLYDFTLRRTGGATGDIRRGGARRGPPKDTPIDPGTPRHPAYPSGHSTYSAAASTVLGCLFPQHKGGFDKLAENIGEARLYGGVHWTDDDAEGRTIGNAVGRLVLEQLEDAGIYNLLDADGTIPDRTAQEAAAVEFGGSESQGDFCAGLPKEGSGNQNRAP